MPTPPSARRRLTASLGVIVAAVAVPVLAPSLGQAGGVAHVAQQSTGASGSTGTPVTDDPNNTTCFGHIQKGAAEQGVTGSQVEYQFSCDGPITGYSIETEPHQIQYFDQAPVVDLSGVTPSGDGFECNGFVPGLQINCVGQASAPLELITGQFAIGAKSICDEPRVDPILTVTEATATAAVGGTKSAPTATATVTQYMAGPYDLGRPWGCKGDQYGSNTRLGANPPKIRLPGRAR